TAPSHPCLYSCSLTRVHHPHVLRILFLYCYRPHQALHSFPTRRSSDLHGQGQAQGQSQGQKALECLVLHGVFSPLSVKYQFWMVMTMLAPAEPRAAPVSGSREWNMAVHS